MVLEVQDPGEAAVLYLDVPLAELALSEPLAVAGPGELAAELEPHFLGGRRLGYLGGSVEERGIVSAPELTAYAVRSEAPPCPWYTRAPKTRLVTEFVGEVSAVVAAAPWGRFVAVEGGGQLRYYDLDGTLRSDPSYPGLQFTGAAFGSYDGTPDHLLVSTSTGTLFEVGPEGEVLGERRLSPEPLTGVAHGTIAGLDRVVAVDALGWVYGLYATGGFNSRPATPFADRAHWSVSAAIGDNGLIWSDTYGAFAVRDNRVVPSELTPTPEHRVTLSVYDEDLGQLVGVSYPWQQLGMAQVLRERLPGDVWRDHPFGNENNDVTSAVPGEGGWLIAGALGPKAGNVGLLEELRPQSRCRSSPSTIRHQHVARIGERIFTYGHDTGARLWGYYSITP